MHSCFNRQSQIWPNITSFRWICHWRYSSQLNYARKAFHPICGGTIGARSAPSVLVIIFLLLIHQRAVEHDWGRATDTGPSFIHARETRWRHGMEALSELLALCEGNPIPHKGSVVQCCGVFFVVSLNNLPNKQSSCWWFETPQNLCDIIAMNTERSRYIKDTFLQDPQQTPQPASRAWVTCLLGVENMIHKMQLSRCIQYRVMPDRVITRPNFYSFYLNYWYALTDTIVMS